MAHYCRNLYDHANVLAQDELSKSAGNFTLSSKPKQHAPKIPVLTVAPVSDSYFNPNRKNHVGNTVDLESSLKGITPHNNKSLSRNEHMKNMAILRTIPPMNDDADRKLLSSETRLEPRSSNLRDGFKPRFDYPIEDPSKRIYNGIIGTSQMGDNRFGINTRHATRDSVDMDEYERSIDLGPPKY